MPDTGWVIAGQGRSVSRGGVAFTNPGRVTADDASYAVASNVAKNGGTTDWIVGDTFALSGLIPDGATIVGVEARIQALASETLDAAPAITSFVIGKSDGALGTAVGGPSLTTAAADYDFGGAADLWDLALSRADVVASTFQVRAYVTNGSEFVAANVSVDAIWVKVHYDVSEPLSMASKMMHYRRLRI